MAEINHDLLLAALAVLTGAVSREAMQGVLVTWAENTERGLAHLLRTQETLDDSRIKALECLVAGHLRSHNGDLRASLEAWNAQALTEDFLTELENTTPGSTLGSTLAETLAPTLSAPLGGNEVPGAATGAGLPSFTQEERFTKIKPHARGGIGQVWLARDRELQRDVAVKEIQPRYVDREDQRKRFLLEAEITGNLEHPGIVPVYSLGQSAEGRPFYAMRFIRGESLSEAIKRFHAGRSGEAASARRRRATIWGVEFQQLLRRFLDVCDAMEYAHSRGVIHRDLKPGNIMLGEYGETLVVDWGLAKIVGKSDIVPVHGECSVDGEFDADVAGATVSVGGETQPGTTIGTPSYMSPEQARGDLAELGPQSDVYSLGATLYEVLTGTFPFPAAKASEILVKVKEGKLTPPRALVPSIPPALEAVCVKAMAYQPDARYRSARELALDLEHWMADEPVVAYPETPLQKFARWLRRHRTWTYAAGAALVLVTLVATIAVFVVDRARRNEEDARNEAEANFEMAQQAVEEYFTNVSESVLLKKNDALDISGLRKDLLRIALSYYERFVTKHSDDPKLRQDLAHAYFRVGEITKEVASPRDALKAYDSALKLWNQLVEDDPENPEVQLHRAETLLAKGRLQATMGQSQDALAPLTQARRILEPLAVRFPADARFQSRLASCYIETGIMQTDLELSDRGLDVLEKAQSILQALIHKNPSNIELSRQLAETMNALGNAHDSLGNYPTSLHCYEQLEELCTDLLKRAVPGPKPIRDQELLALSYYNAGNIHRRNAEDKKALASYEKALESVSALTQSHASITRFKEKLGYIYREVGELQHRLRREAEAIVSVKQAKRIYQELLQAEPDQAAYHNQLALIWNLLGIMHDEKRENALAMESFQQAIREQEVAMVEAKGVNRYKFHLVYHLQNLGEQYVDLGNTQKGLPCYERAVRLGRELSQDQPEDREYALLLVQALSVLGALQLHVGNSGAALSHYAEAATIAERWLKENPGDVGLKRVVASLLNQQASTLGDLNRRQEAQAALDRAASLLRPVCKAAPDDVEARELLSESLWDMARLLRMSGQASVAERLEVERASLWKSRPPQELVNLAEKEAKVAYLIGYGQTPIDPPAETVRKRDEDRAAAHLRQAIENGFKEISRLKSNPDLGLLLERARIETTPPQSGRPAHPGARP